MYTNIRVHHRPSRATVNSSVNFAPNFIPLEGSPPTPNAAQKQKLFNDVVVEVDINVDSGDGAGESPAQSHPKSFQSTTIFRHHSTSMTSKDLNLTCSSVNRSKNLVRQLKQTKFHGGRHPSTMAHSHTHTHTRVSRNTI